jgi:hypothetical protein
VPLWLTLLSLVGVSQSFLCPSGAVQLESRVCLPPDYTSSQLPPNAPIAVAMGFNINYFTIIDDIGLTFSVNQVSPFGLHTASGKKARSSILLYPSKFQSVLQNH